MITITQSQHQHFHLTRTAPFRHASLTRAETVGELVQDHGLLPEEARLLVELATTLGPLTLLSSPTTTSHTSRTGRRADDADAQHALRRRDAHR